MISITGSDSVGGAGVVAEIFPVNKSITFPRFRDIFGTFSGHLRIIRRLWTLAGFKEHFPCLLSHSNHVTTSIHSGKKHFPKVLGGVTSGPCMCPTPESKTSRCCLVPITVPSPHGNRRRRVVVQGSPPGAATFARVA